jgi:hypothetical protein
MGRSLLWLVVTAVLVGVRGVVVWLGVVRVVAVVAVLLGAEPAILAVVAVVAVEGGNKLLVRVVVLLLALWRMLLALRWHCGAHVRPVVLLRWLQQIWLLRQFLEHCAGHYPWRYYGHAVVHHVQRHHGHWFLGVTAFREVRRFTMRSAKRESVGVAVAVGSGQG